MDELAAKRGLEALVTEEDRLLLGLFRPGHGLVEIDEQHVAHETLLTHTTSITPRNRHDRFQRLQRHARCPPGVPLRFSGVARAERLPRAFPPPYLRGYPGARWSLFSPGRGHLCAP